MAYESKAIITTIKATSRVTLKIKDNFYALEFTEERSIPDTNDVDIEAERAMLWEDVNGIVDDQVEITVNAVLGERKDK